MVSLKGELMVSAKCTVARPSLNGACCHRHINLDGSKLRPDMATNHGNFPCMSISVVRPGAAHKGSSVSSHAWFSLSVLLEAEPAVYGH